MIIKMADPCTQLSSIRTLCTGRDYYPSSMTCKNEASVFNSGEIVWACLNLSWSGSPVTCGDVMSILWQRNDGSGWKTEHKDSKSISFDGCDSTSWNGYCSNRVLRDGQWRVYGEYNGFALPCGNPMYHEFRVGGCVDGSRRCNPDNPLVRQECRNSAWVSVDTCAHGCNPSTGLCYPECTPGEKGCVGDARRAECSVNGTWVFYDCDAGYACDAGECLPYAVASVTNPRVLPVSAYEGESLRVEWRISNTGLWSGKLRTIVSLVRSDTGELVEARTSPFNGETIGRGMWVDKWISGQKMPGSNARVILQGQHEWPTGSGNWITDDTKSVNVSFLPPSVSCWCEDFPTSIEIGKQLSGIVKAQNKGGVVVKVGGLLSFIEKASQNIIDSIVLPVMSIPSAVTSSWSVNWTPNTSYPVGDYDVMLRINEA